MSQTHIGVIGGGIAGLAAAYDLARAGARVTLFEERAELGGMAASFALDDGQHIEQYYHFICKPDHAYLALLRELGLLGRVRWVTTRMGLFYRQRHHLLSDPASLLRFPYLSPGDKLRFAYATVQAKLRPASHWHDLEHVPARNWLVSQYGERAYEMIYRPLLTLKFGTASADLSAAWIWARVNRLGNSRTLTQHERLGYLEGGTAAYVDALAAAIQARGGTLRAGARVEGILVAGGRVQGVVCDARPVPCDQVITTVPVPALLPLLPEQDDSFAGLRSLTYLDVVALVLRLHRSLVPTFWTNISDPDIPLAGLIEYTRLNPLPGLSGDAIVYIPQYVPAGHPLFDLPAERLLASILPYLALINPAFDAGWIRSYHVFRTRFAQPVCPVGFSRQVPSVQTSVAGLWLTDSVQMHPHDRTISNSTAQGRLVAGLALAQASAQPPGTG